MPDNEPPHKNFMGSQDRADGFPVVGIGASAGGLEAFRKLLDGLPALTGMASILVQHLDPHHESLLVDLLTGHTAMTVKQAEDGMQIEPEHVYVIPPGCYLSVRAGTLHLSEPNARHGARLPFDFLLQSLAAEYGPRTICVILSGTGLDGCQGIRAVRDQGGLTIVQDPNEAGFDGMPRNAIATGLVDLVLPIAKIPAALIGHVVKIASPGDASEEPSNDWLTDIVAMLRDKTPHDFTSYRTGTL